MYSEDFPDSLNEFIYQMSELWYETNSMPSYIGLFDSPPDGFDIRGRFYESGYDAYMALAVAGIYGIGAVLYDVDSGAWFIGVRATSE